MDIHISLKWPNVITLPVSSDLFWCHSGHLSCHVVMEEYWPLRKEHQGGSGNAPIPCSRPKFSQRSSAHSKARGGALHQHSKVQLGSLQSGRSCSLCNAQRQHLHIVNLRKNITINKHEPSIKM